MKNKLNQPIEEKCCSACKWALKEGCGNKKCICHHPIEEKWKEEFDKKYGEENEYGGVWVMSGSGAGQWRLVNDELESFIENLLEQEKRRMSDEIEGLHKRSAEFEDFSSATVDEVLSIINK